ncbi:MAG: fructosamine kinase family protein [Labilithrix sp.]|nr:fructosamine kinase family protein [Labilithrix sp.]MCW5809772.1 fructosamine kinase family protein [Labilithrix sp.]
MTAAPTFATTLERALGSRPRDASSPPSAGVVELCDGRRVFVKAPHDRRARAMVDAEEHGLAFLRGPRALRVPDVLARGDDFLVLEALELRALDGASAERFGHALAELHRSGAPSFGLDRDNFIGLTEQRNTPHARWADFYRDERILALAERCDLEASTRALVDRVAERMEELVGDAEPPARLHGDLWSGNACAAGDGTPCVFDPAVSGGARELDLAMMRLFGGFPRRTFDAYEESFPLLPGHTDRVALYQLYFLLVHVAIFGSGYVAQTDRCLRTIVR